MQENMDKKEEEKDEEEAPQDIRLMTLSSSFSKQAYIFYSMLRVVKSIMITSTTLWYSYYFLIRTDDAKAYSYFENKASYQLNKKRNCLYNSNARVLLNKVGIGCLIFCVITNVVSKLKKRALTKLLLSIKSSHSQHSSNSQSKIYLSQSDLALLDRWKCLVGGHRYYVGSLDATILIMLYASTLSETTMFDALHQSISQKQQSNDTYSDWKSRYFQFSDDKQEIEWLNKEQEQRVESTAGSLPDIYTDLLLSQRILMGITVGLPTFMLSYSCLPISTLCALHVFKCGLNTKHRQECDNWMWCNKWICSVAFAGCIFQGIINKLHFARYFAIREVSIASYKRLSMSGIDKKNKKKKKKKAKQLTLTERGKLERRVKNLLSLRSFSYDTVSIVPWLCLYVSCVCGKASTYYIKTFASSSLYTVFKGKHAKNKYVLRVVAVSTLMVGVMVGLGNDTYFGSVKYAKRWFMNVDKYSIESYNKSKQIKSETASVTPGNEFINTTTDEESDQIEGGSEQDRIKHTTATLYQRVMNGTYQQETEMLLSNRYFHQKAHDIFEYLTEICVFLEDKLLNSCIIPAF